MGAAMAYDEGLAERVRDHLVDEHGVTERRMFGGLAFLLQGNMCVGVVKDKLMVRVGRDAYAGLLKQPHARKMDFTGRPMKGFLYVMPAGLESDEDLGRWVEHGKAYASSLPEKGALRRGTSRRTRG
jgi:TfoX/Sxy family transcriptional regulator of competence genes